MYVCGTRLGVTVAGGRVHLVGVDATDGSATIAVVYVVCLSYNSDRHAVAWE
jgi:hypothetical protein